VDDQAAHREMVRRILYGAGYTVLTAAGGDEAARVAAIYPGRIGVLLIDVIMPGLRAVEAASRVSELHPGVKVLFMSGYGEHALPGEDWPVLGKPFMAEDLLAKLAEMGVAP
jgi:two-component system cell cycle sensor histidine kinase/response regulator CckA